MSKYHYEYFAYTNNLNYGRLLLGSDRTVRGALRIGHEARKGCYCIEKHRVYDN